VTVQMKTRALAALAAAGGSVTLGRGALAQAPEPVMLHPHLGVQKVVDGLTTPTTMAVLGPNEFFVLEKNTGKVQHVVDGAVQATVLDLAVNFASERGLLGIALHPNFPTNPGVYLYWTCRTDNPPADPFYPDVLECPDQPALGEDTNNVLSVPLRGNRVDRFVWDGSTLAWDRNLVKLRVFQNDAAPVPPGQGDEAQRPAGNHDGGVITFGPDGKLYTITGDVGRRGWMQNLPNGPTPPTPDDQFGGPEADNNHLTSVILRLNDDGGTPNDNPFHAAGEAIGGEVGANIQKVYAYGIRNSFGMAFDPFSGDLWETENGDSSFDEINRILPGHNGGWVQVMGPLSRIEEFKALETSERFFGLQQQRWPPTNLADSPNEALDRMFMLPGAHYSDPEFSWKYVLPPAGIGFVSDRRLGPQFRGDMLVGLAVPVPRGGVLLHFNLTGNRRQIAVDDPRLEDRVADNVDPRDLTESESLVIGENFGVVTDIKEAADGGVYVVSLTNGAVYEITGRDSPGNGKKLGHEKKGGPKRGR